VGAADLRHNRRAENGRPQFAGLVTAIPPQKFSETVVWATFYDIRRYGGLQIFLRAVLGGASLILFKRRRADRQPPRPLEQHGVTHLSGTPSHWRRALMSPDIGKISPGYVRLSGEIADQAILDNLRVAFPNSSVGHAYASTEAGVAFAVNDGLAGFPAAYFEGVRDGVEMKVVDGSCTFVRPARRHATSPRRAGRYSTPTASLTPGTCWSSAAIVISSLAARGASSISAA